jgi:hypothetical protein
VCRRIYNRVQHIVYVGGEQKKRERLKENVLPVTVLASLIVGSIAAPILPRFAGPLAIAQARKPHTPQDTITEAPPPKIVRSKTTGSTNLGTRKKKNRPPQLQSPTNTNDITSSGYLTSIPVTTAPTLRSSSSSRTKADKRQPSLTRRSSHSDILSAPELPTFSPSCPDLRLPLTASPAPSTPSSNQRWNRKERTSKSTTLSNSKKVYMLRANYFRREDQFLSALDKISNKLVVVPKQARLSALRAELALLNNDLPAEVDIPVICPASSHQNKSQTSHHRVVRINPAEATVLNSAERVPYLLMVEVLLDDFDFDPTKPENETLLANLVVEEASGCRNRLFDLSEAPRTSTRVSNPEEEGPSSVFEPSAGDIGTSPIISDLEFGPPREPSQQKSKESSVLPSPQWPKHSSAVGNLPSPQWPRSSSGTNSLSTQTSLGGTPRSSEISSSRSVSPMPRKSGRPISESPDLSALATHMRTAASMLAQLEASGSKRPKSEVAAIKDKIIASMQTLEEQSFFFEETAPIPTFDTIMASAANAPLPTLGGDPVREGDGTASNSINAEAGAARMENDQMTSGVERKADRDDPSAATFGEEWTAKRERIRKSSPYGWCRNWDLLSVIVKTGADLRQEAFACQLIHVCGKIWERANVPVWIKRMRILVTGEASPFFF